VWAGAEPGGAVSAAARQAPGARVTTLDISPERLARAMKFGADEVVDPHSNDPVGASLRISRMVAGRTSRWTVERARGIDLGHRRREGSGEQ
jgi:threonine dehydrogenase-like Zn-dependent dehydrogenase